MSEELLETWIHRGTKFCKRLQKKKTKIYVDPRIISSVSRINVFGSTVRIVDDAHKNLGRFFSHLKRRLIDGCQLRVDKACDFVV